MTTAEIISLVLGLIPGIVSSIGLVQSAVKQHETVPQIIGAVLSAIGHVSTDAAPKVAALPADAPAAPAPAAK